MSNQQMTLDQRVERIPLEKILPNPYQTRKSEDPEHVKNLAASIAKNGLLQIPSARVLDFQNQTYQLTFGHSRLAAFKYITETGIPGYDSMPLNIVEMNDEQMFQAAVVENRDRKDLTPIEEAEAMLVYRDQFTKTSEEVGELFHLSDSAVRNKIRLLELPDEIKERVGKTITEGAAREVLAVTELPEEVQNHKVGWKEGTLQERVVKMVSSGVSPEEVHDEISSDIRTMGEELSKKLWKHTEELSGEGIVGICKGCAFLAKRDNTDWCLNKVCFIAKTHAWKTSYLTQASLLSGIPVSGDVDERFSDTDFQYGHETLLKKIRKATCENLRLVFDNYARREENDHRATHLGKEGYPLAKVVCSKRRGQCTCMKAEAAGVTVEDGTPMDKQELKELNQRILEQKRIDKELVEHLKIQTAVAITRALMVNDFATWKVSIQKLSYTGTKSVVGATTWDQLVASIAENTVNSSVYSDEKKYVLSTCNGLLVEMGLPELGIQLEAEAQEDQPGKTLMEVLSEEGKES